MNNYRSSSESTRSSDREDMHITNESIDDNEVVIYDTDDSSLGTESSFYSDIESDSEYDTINQLDYQHFYSEKEDGKYYIGLCDYNFSPNHILMASSISSTIYFKYPNRSIVHYLYYYSGGYCGVTRHRKLCVDIMKINILDNGTYTVLVKTFWIRLIQRRWKKIYKRRMECIHKRKQLHYLKYRECNGHWPSAIRNLPGLGDMFILNLFVKCH